MRTKGTKSNLGGNSQLLPAILLLAGFLLVGVNQARVQVFGREKVLQNAEKVNRLFSRKTIVAQRGDIFARDGRLLARSENTQKLGLDPNRLPASPAFWGRVAEVAGLSSAELIDFVLNKGGAKVLDVSLTRQQVEELEKIKSYYGADGIWFEETGTRQYRLGQYAATLLGYVERGVGKAGIERTQNELLQGKNGVMVGMTDRTGNFLPWMTRAADSEPARDGASLGLTIDSDMQVLVSRALAEQCEHHKAEHGAAIVMDPHTGDILALATWPGYDPGRADEAQQELAVSPQFNPALAMRFEPGSTFKIFTIALGLETGEVTEGETVNCAGSKQFANKLIRCAGDHGPKSHGVVTAAKCVEVSCNIAAATWGARLGFDKMSKMIHTLGLLDKQNVGVTPEIPGYLNENDWNKTLQCANLGFGQSLNVSPLGLASAFTVFANGGRRAHPRLISSIDGRQTPVKTGEQVFKPETAAKMMKMMQAVVQGEHGTGHKLTLPGYLLAGKTGTAQKLGSAEGGYVSSFVGYVPAESPRALVLVMVDNPRANGFYGAQVAGPVFKETAKFILKTYRIPPSRVEAKIETR